jgi:hypothetical protein
MVATIGLEIGVQAGSDCLELGDHGWGGDLGKPAHFSPLPRGRLVEYAQGAQVEKTETITSSVRATGRTVVRRRFNPVVYHR